MQAKSVLIIDDDRYLRLVMEDVFVEAGFKVLSAENGQAGMKLLVHDHPDVVLLDQNMPKMSGDEFMIMKREVTDVAPIPVIIISAVPDRTKGLGAAAYVPKPIDFDKLLAEVQKQCHLH